MNRLDIPLGGHHLIGDDILFLQTQLAETIKAFAETTGQPLLVISGVSISFGGGNIIWTAGWMLLNGEVCKVDTGSAAYPANNTWTIAETYDPAGLQTNEDLAVVNTYVLRKAVINGAAGGTNHNDNIKRLSSYLINPILSNAPNWTDFAAEVNSPTWAVTVDVPSYRKTAAGDEVVMKGVLSCASYGASKVLTLPLGFRPFNKGFANVLAEVGGVLTNVYVEIRTTGEVHLIGPAPGASVTLYLDGIRVHLAG